MSGRYRDRRSAGRELARELLAYAGFPDLLVLALPRGGVPVGFEIARALGVPLDVMLVRKLGVPGFDELAMGAIASGGVRFLNEGVIREHRVPREAIDHVTAREWRELQRRERRYRGSRQEPSLNGRTVMLVDDGLATGATMRTAIAAVRARAADRVTMALPVAPRDSFDALAGLVDNAVCPMFPEPFDAVGRWYDDFTSTSDEEVCALLEEIRDDQPAD